MPGGGGQREDMCKGQRSWGAWQVAPCCQSQGGGSGRNLRKMSLGWRAGPGRPLLESLGMLLSVGHREPLKTPEHKESIRFVLGRSQAVGLRLAPCTYCEPPEEGAASHFLSIPCTSVPKTHLVCSRPPFLHTLPFFTQLPGDLSMSVNREFPHSCPRWHNFPLCGFSLLHLISPLLMDTWVVSSLALTNNAAMNISLHTSSCTDIGISCSIFSLEWDDWVQASAPLHF